MEYLKNDIFYAIVGRREAEKILKNDNLQDVLLISVLNPKPTNEVYNELKREIEKGKKQIEVFFTEKGKVYKRITTNEEAKEYLKRKSYLLETEDYNFLPINENLKKKLKDILEVRFWDIEEKIRNYDPIDEKEAEKIVNFILKHENSLKKRKTKILLHCSAGVSRSAAVALAVKAIVDFEGEIPKNCEILNFKRYKPNFFVAKKIIEIYKKKKEI